MNPVGFLQDLTAAVCAQAHEFEQAMDSEGPQQTIYVVSLFAASLLFIFGLRGLSHPSSARRGMTMAAVGMLIAIVGTLLHERIVNYEWIAVGLVLGTIIGIPMGLWIPMTKMPERIALSHCFGGLAVALVGIAEYFNYHEELDRFNVGAVSFEVLLGAITFTGSLMAFGKLQGILSGRPHIFRGQNIINFCLLGAAVLMLAVLVARPDWSALFYTLTGLGFLLGILLVVPIGGADMPVVICLLNSYAGMAAAATGFTLNNPVLIVCGALDGGSGFILAMIMSKAMNRSFRNVLFGGFGAEESSAATVDEVYGGKVKSATTEDVAAILGISRRVVFAPGYGMAVSQAQYAVRDLMNFLESKGVEVEFAIHPVAGRMPGHMNVLLAEANIPYDKLKEMDEINPTFAQTDAVIVVGANDTVNPIARTDPKSPIAGMPILDVDKAQTVIVLKRSLSPGFAGIPNPLFAAENTLMLFEDAKKGILGVLAALKGAQ